jgi:hypothetical protein
MSVSEARLERVMRLVKLGAPIDVLPGAYALRVDGRPTYGTIAYYERCGGHKALVLSAAHSHPYGVQGVLGIDQMMDHNRENGLGYWRPLHPKLEAMIMLALMGKIP